MKWFRGGQKRILIPDPETCQLDGNKSFILNMKDISEFGETHAARRTIIKTVAEKVVNKEIELVKQKVEAFLEGGRLGKEYLQKCGEQAVNLVTDKVPEELIEVALKGLKERVRKELLKDPSVYFTSEDTRQFLNMMEVQNHSHFYVRSPRITQWIASSSARVAKGIEEVCGHHVTPEVYVVQNPDIAYQAFALGSGAVIIELSLLEMLESQDELDFIMAHEFAHIALKHSVTLLNFDTLSQKCLGKFITVFSEKTGGLFDQKLLNLKRTTESFIKDHAYKALRHSDEFEADEIACKVLHTIGAQRNAGETLMQKFKYLHGESDGECPTHPSDSARIIRLNDITEFKWNPPPRDYPVGVRKTLKWARKVIRMKTRFIETIGWITGISLFAGCVYIIQALHNDEESRFLMASLDWQLIFGSLVLCGILGFRVSRRMYHLLKS